MMTAEQLKNSILQLALQGKLVPQNSNDKKASDLLKEDQKNKKNKGRRNDVKQKTVSQISRNAEGEYVEYEGTKNKSLQGRIPFEIPDSWEWIHLGYVCDIARGGSPRPIKSYLTEREDGINWIKIGDSDIGGKYINSTKEKIIPEGMKKSRFVHAGDFLLTNSMSFGRPYILNCDGCIHDGWLVLTGYKEVYDKEFLYYMLVSGYAFNQFCDVVSGAVVKNLNSDKVADAIFPVPPLEEQKRIVAKIEELMPFVEQYAAASTKLNTLNASFPEMMKKSILQEAVQGKLVPQDPNDEPASLLLKKIAEEKKRLIKEGKIKKQKPLPEITEDEIPFDIPESWEWCYINDIAFVTKLAGFEYTKNIAPNLTNKGIPLFKGKNVQNGRLVMEFESFIPESISDELSRSQLDRKCLLTPYVGTIGNIAIFNGEFKAHLGSNVGKIEILNSKQTYVMEEYVLHYLRSPEGYKQLTKYKKATAQESISIDAIRNVIIGIPPLKEQIRIVEKIDRYMSVADKLYE